MDSVHKSFFYKFYTFKWSILIEKKDKMLYNRYDYIGEIYEYGKVCKW